MYRPSETSEASIGEILSMMQNIAITTTKVYLSHKDWKLALPLSLLMQWWVWSSFQLICTSIRTEIQSNLKTDYSAECDKPQRICICLALIQRVVKRWALLSSTTSEEQHFSVHYYLTNLLVNTFKRMSDISAQSLFKFFGFLEFFYAKHINLFNSIAGNQKNLVDSHSISMEKIQSIANIGRTETQFQ